MKTFEDRKGPPDVLDMLVAILRNTSREEILKIVGALSASRSELAAPLAKELESSRFQVCRGQVEPSEAVRVLSEVVGERDVASRADVNPTVDLRRTIIRMVSGPSTRLGSLIWRSRLALLFGGSASRGRLKEIAEAAADVRRLLGRVPASTVGYLEQKSQLIGDDDRVTAGCGAKVDRGQAVLESRANGSSFINRYARGVVGYSRATGPDGRRRCRATIANRDSLGAKFLVPREVAEWLSPGMLLLVRVPPMYDRVERIMFLDPFGRKRGPERDGILRAIVENTTESSNGRGTITVRLLDAPGWVDEGRSIQLGPY